MSAAELISTGAQALILFAFLRSFLQSTCNLAGHGMTITDKIINTIRRNRISTTEIADCMNKTGALAGVFAVTPGSFKVGRVKWVYAFDESNYSVHKQIRDVGEREVVLVSAFNCNNRAIFGSLVSKFLILYRQVEAIVVDGFLRDAPHLIKERWPIWCTGFTPIGTFNTESDKQFDCEIINEYKNKYEGAVAVCDDSGVVVVPRSLHCKSFLDQLHDIEEQEDIWFDCIDRLKWDTFDTVCLKKYKYPVKRNGATGDGD